MKLIFVQYLASLKERGELDVIVPDLLSEIGYTVISRPAIGTKQYGVDVAAVGEDSKGVQTLYLLSIKPGELRRSNWDSGSQPLRSSLNQILDVYIRNHVPTQYANLPVCIVLCLGGDLHEDVRADVVGFMKNNTTDRITFALWNGDRLADHLLSGVLRENAMPQTWQADFRKSVALVDEPDVGFGHFCRFVRGIVKECKPDASARLTAIRQIYLGVWTLYVWARQAKNIESAYRSSERALLISWPLVKDYLAEKPKEGRQLGEAMERLVSLHSTIADDFLTSYLQPRAHLLHGLTIAVPSQSSLDVNLRSFDLIGRIGTQGLWLLRALHCVASNANAEQVNGIRKQLHSTARLLAVVLQNNPILCTPIKDNQVIDINIACLFLNKVGCNQVVQTWIQKIARATQFAYDFHRPYPCVFDDYRDLVDHPKKDPDYRTDATAASILVPTLAVWAAVTEDLETLVELADFASEQYKHSTLQLWYPGPDTEEHLYVNSANHGLTAIDVSIERNCPQMLANIVTECASSAAFTSLSVLEYGLWPLLLTASRHHRVPVPPHLWPFSQWAMNNLQ